MSRYNDMIKKIINDQKYPENIMNIIDYKKYNYYPKTIDTNYFINEKHFIKDKIDKYMKATSLNSIFKQRSAQTPGPTNVTRWSPQSSAGLVYEWDRGVIAIGDDGTVIKEKLDGTLNHHADATIRVANQLGITLEPTNQPYLAGCEASANNLVVFQSEGNDALFYLPESISDAQAQAIEEIAAPRKNFSFSISYMGYPLDDLTYDILMSLVQIRTQRIAMAM